MCCCLLTLLPFVCYSGQAELQPSHVMGVSMSADHRVVDGATVARFCNSLKRLVEHPALMLAHLK